MKCIFFFFTVKGIISRAREAAASYRGLASIQGNADTVSVNEETNSRKAVKSAVFFLESVVAESEICIWKIADVRKHRDPASKGRPLSRKQKDLRFKLPSSVRRKFSTRT
ncbi:unnamed protein product [Brassica oleracea var. botrytis]|uniref:DUF7912 domain-containing protein n=1 Tax=Brassica oleracea TaxID=3712 RepID=A0A3P6HD91_BRAOL|nr:unnamed protein product [Brassica oleracea]